MASIHIGVGGWDYEPWRETFYPPKLAKVKQLEYVGAHLTATEVNATYYSSQALAQVGGNAWDEIFPQISRNLLEEQTASGAWPPGPGTETHFGSGYSTSLAVLSLTPAYQLLPIYQR